MYSNAILSPNHRHRLDGIERSDSVLWSLNKALCLTLSAAVLITRHPGLPQKVFGHNADYLFFDNALYNGSSWDNGDASMQCTRRPEILKQWLTLRARGSKGHAAHVDYLYNLTGQVVQEIKNRNQSFKLILDQFEGHHVTFYYIPRSLRHLDGLEIEMALKKSMYTEKLGEYLLNLGILSISVDSLPDHIPLPFFVMNLANSILTLPDLSYLLDQIEKEGESDHMIRHLEAGSQLKSNENSAKTLAADGIEKAQTQALALKSPSSIPSFVSSPVKSFYGQLFDDFWALVLNNATYFEDDRRQEFSYLYRAPNELQEEFDFSLGSDQDQVNNADLLDIFGKVIKCSGHNGHPFYGDHLTNGLDPYSVMADYLAGALNSPIDQEKLNPIYTVIGNEILLKVRKLVGYPHPRQGGGIGLMGGSTCLEVASFLARLRKSPEVEQKGVVATKKQLVAFISTRAHYASIKSTFFMGIGTDNCVRVKADRRGRMLPSALEKAINKTLQEGKVPYIVVATAGTTVFGAFDPINAIADICERHNIWLHVDGSYGGTNIFSLNSTRKQILLRGLERSDSFNFNGHKMLSVVRGSAFIVAKRKPTFDLNRLFPQNRANMLKFWFMWKAKGLEGMGAHVEAGYQLTKEVVQEIFNRPVEFRLPPDYKPQSPHINFQYIPKRFRDVGPRTKKQMTQLDGIQSEIIALIKIGRGIVLMEEPEEGNSTTLVLCLYNSGNTFEDIKYILDIIDLYGKDL